MFLAGNSFMPTKCLQVPVQDTQTCSWGEIIAIMSLQQSGLINVVRTHNLTSWYSKIYFMKAVTTFRYITLWEI